MSNNDLISRDALKKEMDKKAFDLANGGMIFIESINHIIDNAPTVEYTFEEAFQKTVCEKKLYCPERPQGEWINREAVSNTIFPFWERYECNQCHKFNGYSNFCPNCGAKMKGGAE